MKRRNVVKTHARQEVVIVNVKLLGEIHQVFVVIAVLSHVIALIVNLANDVNQVVYV
jgi:hypothetical protein